jgi:cobalt-zinc-cadmium efflux system protein
MDNRRVLTLALLITLLIFVVELVGGFLSNSLALLSDAGHMLTDSMALALALLASVFAALPATRKRTFGFYRLEILSALFNGSVLTILALFIFYQAYLRFLQPAAIRSDLMLMIATIGFLANIGAAVILAGASRENLNVRGAFLHVLSDTASSAGVIIGGILIHFLGWSYVDPILGLLIGILILRGALGLVFDSVNILLEAVPEGVSVEEVAGAIREVDGVEDIHDLHVWAITSGMNAASAHVVIKETEIKRAPAILKEINEKLRSKYKIAHSTFQTECESCTEEEHGHHH